MKAIALLAFAFAVNAVAADGGWRPDRPVRLLSPQAPGGAADAAARAFTPKFLEALGQPWVLDNRPGAAGNIAAIAPGQTIFLLNTSGAATYLADSSSGRARRTASTPPRSMP